MDIQGLKETTLNFLGESSHTHPIRTVLMMALLPLGLFSAGALLFPYHREIVYEMHTVFATCLPDKADTCAARVELIIGNTGNAEESVNLTWPDYQGSWTRGERVLNISADRRRNRDPAITCAIASGRQECIIDQFDPGAMVILHMDCYQCSRQQVQRLAETPLGVQTEAHIAYGDPRVAVLLGRLLVLAQFF
ncbi:MAG: hypothetical protein HW386_1802 [Gammaproteobacteria bacterium]|nr:hypothetical protein [Gammaproteobacteria bacterium]